MNLKLKSKIVEKYGTQSDFAPVVNEDETIISRVIRGRRELNPEKQKIWADVLGCEPKELFQHTAHWGPNRDAS